MQDFRHDFIAFALRHGVLRFGEFITKAGRASPYFFDSGRFDSGATLGPLGGYYAQTLLEAERARGLRFDMLYGPAYKGITLAAATAIGLCARDRDVPFAFNRKEAKAHGEGGALVGAPLAGRVVIVDDVITDGASKRESVDIIRTAGAQPAAVLIALDRKERPGRDDALASRSAVEEFESEFGVPVLAIATVDDLLQFLQASADPQFARHRDRVATYRERYGVLQPSRSSA